jgi:hypothetical protein
VLAAASLWGCWCFFEVILDLVDDELDMSSYLSLLFLTEMLWIFSYDKMKAHGKTHNKPAESLIDLRIAPSVQVNIDQASV